MSIDLKNKRFGIFGLQGSGKSELAKYLLKNTRDSIVYDVLDEYQGLNRYKVTRRQVQKQVPTDPAIMELNNFVNRVVIGTGMIRMFILEEANRYCPAKPAPLPASIVDLNDFQRHQKIAFGCITRRPVQLNTDLAELAHYLFIFHLVGKNDIQYLESICEGLGDAVKELEPFHFVVVPPRRSEFYVHAPIPLDIKGDFDNSAKDIQVQTKLELKDSERS